jgi:hypothetical protein
MNRPVQNRIRLSERHPHRQIPPRELRRTHQVETFPDRQKIRTQRLPMLSDQREEAINSPKSSPDPSNQPASSAAISR